MTCRWWTPEELAECREALWPPQLVELLAELRRGGPPERPIDLGYVPNDPR